MSSSDDYIIGILRNVFVYANRYILPVLYIVSSIGNVLSMLIFFKRAWRKNVCVFYFLICICLSFGYMNFGMFMTILNVNFNINVFISHIIVCKLVYYVAYIVSTLLPTILILASIDRLLISSQNVDTRLYSSKRLAYFSISISTVLWSIFYFHLIIKMYIYEIYPSSTVCYYELSGFYVEFNFFSNLVINILLSIALLILSILAYKNVRRIRAIPRQQRQQFRSMSKKDFQLLRCLYVYDIIYIIFVAFPSFYGVYLAITKDRTFTPLGQAIKDFFKDFGTFIHHIPYCASFYIFISISTAFRQEIKRLIWKIIDKNPRPIQEEENNGRNTIKLNIVSLT